MFRSLSEDSSGDSTLFRITIIADALNCHPDISSWYDSFGAPTPSDLLTHDVLVQEIDYSQENPVFENPFFYYCHLIKAIPTSLALTEWGLMNKVWSDDTKQPHHHAPWKDVAVTLTPSSYASTHMTSSAPDCTAEVSWVYGYQAEKSKNNLRYTSSKGQCIVYHVGRYGIVYGFDSHKQTIFSGHQHEILCLAIHSVGLLLVHSHFLRTAN